MKVLGIESSCDETGVAVVACVGEQSPRLLSQALHSQVDMHRAYGGVVPELASRDHIRRVVPLLTEVLGAANLRAGAIDVIAFTRGPGLAGALLTGAGVACALGASLRRPVMGIHHLEGHLLSPFLSADAPRFPFVALLVSGGHTQLMRVDSVGEYHLLGETIDDAAGEAFDKSAQLLGLDYPGGAALSRLAEQGRDDAIALPRPLMHSGSMDFSFSGLKTSVRQHVARFGSAMSPQDRADMAASTERAIVDVLVHKSLLAIRMTGLSRLVVAGGVSANQVLRRRFDAASASEGFRVHYPELALCSDNGAMIALAAAMRLQRHPREADANYAFDVKPRWPLAPSPSS